MSEEGNPYEEHSGEILEYCEKCCSECLPSEMCPGCDCSDYCRGEEEEEEEEWVDPDECLSDCEADGLDTCECCVICGVPCDLCEDPPEEDEWW